MKSVCANSFLHRTLARAVWLILLAALSACTAGRMVSPVDSGAVTYPAQWARATATTTPGAASQCLTPDAQLAELLALSLEHNLTLKTLRHQLEEARLGVTVARADRFPTLSASLSTTRRQNNANLFQAPTQQYDLGADGQFEVDLLGRLSAAQRQAQQTYRAAEYDYTDSVRTVLANVARAWYSSVFAEELEDVLTRRVKSVSDNLDIIEQGYRQGINSALDVYLARTSLAQEEARLESQRQTVFESNTSLQLLLNEYPTGEVAVLEHLPRVPEVSVGSGPEAMIERRPDVQRAWAQLLAQDAAVAVAHKQRFPRLVISAGIDDLEQDLADIFDGKNLVWSAVANLSQPVFQGGRLRALEAQARERLAQAELNYLGQLQLAFGEVEDALSQNKALIGQVAASERAVDAADAAYELSFQQYRRGLVNYATVLESEQRAFDATSSLLDLRFRQWLNRIDLCSALGDFPRQLSTAESAS